MSDYPYHLRRRRSRGPLSFAQHERFKAEQAAARRELLTQLIREEVHERGTAGYNDIEQWAFQALDRTVDPGDSTSIGVSRTRVWSRSSGECPSEGISTSTLIDEPEE